ncbi:MAG: hypothetical protein QOD63_82 [Actinomycetota bacterium]|jgi:hypothetical protein|nr:hypothetical protein [Actinomycetota bacterium]
MPNAIARPDVSPSEEDGGCLPESLMTSFVYLVEGEPHVGTVTDYAKAVEEAHYADLMVDNTVWTFVDGKPQPIAVQFPTTGGYDENDWLHLTIEVELVKGDPEVATIRIDGRS